MVRINAGSVVLDGAVLANGQDGHGGGGSGGGIYIATTTLSGSGSISAGGGDATRGGGGGRVALYAENFTGFDTSSISAPGGIGQDAHGGAGTVHVVEGKPHTHVRDYAPIGSHGGRVTVLDHILLEFNNPIDLGEFDSSDVILEGPLGPIVPTSISDVGNKTYRLDFAPQSENGYYHFTVLPTILDLDGVPLDEDANGVPGEEQDVFTFSLILDTVAPRATNHSPNGDVTGTVQHVDVWFSEFIDTTSLSVDDVTITQPDAQPLAVNSVVEFGLNRYRISFAPLTIVGLHHVQIGPDVIDLAGNLLNIDGDGIFGEPVDDVYDAAFNFVPVDLQVTDVSTPSPDLFAGDAVQVNWQVNNASGGALLGDWTDGVYLSDDEFWDVNDILLTTVEHSGGLADGETYSESASVLVPGVLPGSKRLIVRADVYDDEQESGDDSNNVGASDAVPLSVNELVPGGAPAAGQLTMTDRADYFAVNLDGGESLRLDLSSSPGGAVNSLYVSYAAIPTQQSFDHRSSVPGTSQSVELTGIATGGTYYVFVHSNLAHSTTTYSLSAEVAPFFITNITPNRHGDATPAVATITGAGFDETTTVAFISGGHPVAMPVQYVSPTTLILPSVADILPAVFTVRVTKGAATAELVDGFELIEDGEARLVTNLIGVRAVNPRFPVKQTLWVEYRNVGEIAMPAPLLQVTADSHGLLTADEDFADSLRETRAIPNSLGNSVQVLGIGSSGTPGLLQPGESGRIPVYYVGLSLDEGQQNVGFSLGSLTSADTTEKVAYLDDVDPPERVVFERPRHGERNIDPYEPVFDFRVVRSNTSGTGITAAIGGGGGGNPGGSLGAPLNTYEELLVINWNEFRFDNRPESIPQDAWDAILYNLRDDLLDGPLGSDLWADYVAEIAENASYLGAVGQVTNSVSDLFSFEIAQASAALNPIRYLAGAVDVSIPAPGLPLTFSRVYGQSIVSRFEVGTLGRGWSHNWDVRAQLQDNGDVILHGPGGVDRFFVRNANGTYSSSAGDFGVLTWEAEGLRLTETDQTIWQFAAGSSPLNYVEDPNGNRITLAYNFGRLISLTHSSGQSITLEYNHSSSGPAYLTKVVDTMGPGTADDRITTFDYDFDAAGPYLIHVTAPGNRVTQYAYLPQEPVLFESLGVKAELNPSIPMSGPRSHALDTVTHPDATQDFFAYNDLGRLSSVSKNGGAETVSFEYVSPGGVLVTDASNRVTHLNFGLGGQLAEVRDGAGRIVSFGYDSQFQFDALGGPGGEQYDYTYDDNGNLTGIRDALNLEATFTYEETFNQLDSFTDARDNGIDYQYDPRGNLTGILYVDGTQETFTHDSFGNVLTATNRRSQTITYTYNAAGQVKTKDYDTTPAFVDFVYDYDTAGNLETATSANGVTSMMYDSATDLLTRIDYPGGKFFTFDYDAAGRRTFRQDQDGNVVNYIYDAIGRLDRMTDGTAALIVDYDYDAAGRLSRKTLGNGVYSTYQYDAAGNLLHLVNYRPDSSVLSHFDYTYDVSGRRKSMTTNEGTYQYAYDALGQLAGVRYPDGRIVSYDYDEAGNRRQVVDDGVVTPYTTNDLNQYLTVGGVVYAYDLDGNLISKTDGAQTTTYTYNIENRLIRVEVGTDVWEYAYDAFGNRIATTHNGVATQYVIDPTGLGNVAAEYDGTGNLIARYDHGYGLLARTDIADASVFYTFSAIGSSSELTDAAGVTLNTYVYDPWGESLSKSEAVANPFEFVGEYGLTDEGNGLTFMRARYHEHSLGRFLTADPINIAGGSNLYTYVGNHPAAVDATGLYPEFDVFNRIEREIRQQFGAVEEFLEDLTLEVQEILSSLPQIPNSRFSDGLTASAGLTLGASVGFSAGSCLGVSPSMSVVPNIGPGFCIGLSVGLGVGWSQGFSLNVLSVPVEVSQLSRSRVGRGQDPNDKLSPVGSGDAAYVRADESLSYTIRFENQPIANAPAQEIVITDTLDADLDLDTFELIEIAFGEQRITVPAGLKEYETTLPIQANGVDILVTVKAALDRETRVLTLVLRSIDPLTGWMPDDPLTGLLYPNDETGRGEGFIRYVVRPLAALPSGTVVTNRASIVFDLNDPIQTPLVMNTLDAGTPSSTVAPLPAETTHASFDVTWSGQDEPGGSGIAGYDVYVSVNGGEYALWLSNFEGTTETFTGIHGSTYAFYSIAHDHVGHREAVPQTADAQTTLNYPATFATALSLNAGNTNRSGLHTLILHFNGGATIAAPTSLNLLNHTTGQSIDLSTATLQSNGTVSVTWDLSGITLPDGRYTAELSSTAATPALVQTATIEFWKLYGDLNGDGIVNFNDTIPLSSNFGASGVPFIEGDSDGDGIANFNDTIPLSLNFGATLAPLSYDYGDAPETATSFPTTLSNNGARHVIEGNMLYLGAVRDGEADGQPDPTASADGADEDGVGVVPLIRGANVAVTVTSSGAGFVNGWVDFNQDGDWDDAGEQVFADTAVVAGPNGLQITVPAGATLGDTMARFRLTASAGYSYFGLAPNGEVEDYQLSIVDPALDVPPDVADESLAPSRFVRPSNLLDRLFAIPFPAFTTFEHSASLFSIGRPPRRGRR